MEEPEELYKPAEKLDLKDLGALPKSYTKVHCPSCGEEANAANLNLQNSVAKCSSCNTLFSIHEDIKRVNAPSEMKQGVLRPEGIELFYFQDDLDITVQQHIQGLDAFGVVMLPILAVFSIFLYYIDKFTFSPFIPIALTLGAIYYIYKAFNYSNNKTYIDVNKRFLHIKSRPKHFIKDRTYYVNEIDQLYIKQDPSAYYSINIIINSPEGQKHQKLLTVKTISKAKYLEQEIERYLDIENKEVPESNV